MRIALPLTALATVLACSLATAPANARARVFVASYGNDGNPCTFGSPCKTFQQAVNVVDAGGEVTAIDSAGFGPISITKAVTITSPDGVEAGIVPVAGGNAITINAGATDSIGLRGLTINGAGVALDGVVFNTGGILTVQNCVIRNVTGQGINFGPTTASSLSVSHTYVGNNGGYGILVQPTGSGSATATFDHVETQYNSANAYGISIDATLTSGAISATATDSVSSNNGGGFLVQASAANKAILVLVRCVVVSNHTGIQAGNAGGGFGKIVLTENTITGNQDGTLFPGAEIPDSYGNNNIDFNSFNNTSVPVLALK